MVRETEVKFPNSLNLFRFCRRVLDHKFGSLRVIDQDVGQILDFDPADCSHWKKGKKNIRSIQAIKQIADHLQVDEKLVVDVASGEMNSSEAFFEYSGYGDFKVDPEVLSAAKKSYYRSNAGTWSKEKEEGFRNFFTIQREKIEAKVSEIQERISFHETPLYLPEVAASYPEINLAHIALGEDEDCFAKDISVEHTDSGITINYCTGSEVKPFIRFGLARAMAAYFLNDFKPSVEGLEEYVLHVTHVQANVFAAKLLVPDNLLKAELTKVDPSKDISTQLAEVFWVSKTLMNLRLRDLLMNS